MSVCIHSLIHSDHFYSAPSSPLLLRGAPDYSTDTVSEFHVEAHSGTGNCREMTCPRSLRGGYRAGVEPSTFRLKVVVSTKAPPRPTIDQSLQLLTQYLYFS